MQASATRAPHAAAAPARAAAPRGAAPRRAAAAPRCAAAPREPAAADPEPASRREFVLHSANALVLGALFTWGATPRPSSIGVRDYGGGLRTLGLCPPTPNCISTAEEANDDAHFVPGWAYDPSGKRGKTQAQAMAELAEVVSTLQPDGFTPTIVQQTEDYLYAEYQSPTFGFIDDVEFFFSKERPGEVDYRSASRIGQSDGDANRKRIRALRKELDAKYKWKSVGF